MNNTITRFAFRLFLIYFFLQAVPLDWKFYQQLFSIDWVHLHYGAIFDLAHYSPSWSSGAQRFADWGILLGIAAVGALVWGFIDVRRRGTAAAARPSGADGPSGSTTSRWSDDNLYYWVRVIVRYRLAVGMIAYGFIKLFTLQSPYPSLGNLNTSYGDFTRWKLFSLSLGIVPSYESFLGGVEIVGGLLLLYRKSASVGAFIIAIFLGNVFMSNLAYGGGEAVYSLYLLSLALFVLSHDAQRLANLLVFQRPAEPNRFQPVFRVGRQRQARLALKAVFIFFFVFLYGFKTRSGAAKDPYQFPTSEGPGGSSRYLQRLAVCYRKKIRSLIQRKTDPVRWQDVVFERWATLSIRSNRPVLLDSANTERPELTGDDRDYELEGAAGRHYYRYTVDTVSHTLILENKNPHYSGEKWVLRYDRPGEGRIVLSGVGGELGIGGGPGVGGGPGISGNPGIGGSPGSGKDSVYVVLDRVDKKYLLEEARKKGRQGGLSL